MRTGAQLYTLRQYTQTESDLDETLRRLSSIGYTAVQLSAVGPIAPQTVRELCDRHGMDIVVTHTAPDRILQDTDQVVKEHELYRCSYVGIGALPDRYRRPCWIDRFPHDFSPAAEKLRLSGKKLLYHNHNFEWERFPDGRRIIDILVEALPAESFGFILDTYWVQAAGADIATWIRRLKGRIPCIHFKDMAVKGFAQRFAPIGDGNIDFEAIVSLLQSQGETDYILVEQDDCYDEDPFRCLEKSYRVLKEMGIES